MLYYKLFCEYNPINLGIGKMLCQLLYDKLLHNIHSLLADQLMWWIYGYVDPSFQENSMDFIFLGYFIFLKNCIIENTKIEFC